MKLIYLFLCLFLVLNPYNIFQCVFLLKTILPIVPGIMNKFGFLGNEISEIES